MLKTVQKYKCLNKNDILLHNYIQAVHLSSHNFKEDTQEIH